MRITLFSRLAALLLAVSLLAACDNGTSSSPAPAAAPQASSAGNPATIPDSQIRAQVENAIASATDLPPDYSVAVNGGVVSISGSMRCEDCGGMRTPGNVGTVQQTLGAVVRAVPGVERVEFSLDYGI